MPPARSAAAAIAVAWRASFPLAIATVARELRERIADLEPRGFLGDPDVSLRTDLRSVVQRAQAPPDLEADPLT
jgi:hypothetical protein